MSTQQSKPNPARSAHDADPDIFLNEARAADLISVNPRTLQQWRMRGTGPQFVRISSRCVRYRYRDLMAWADERLCSSTSEGAP
jgi:hypothetical protein